MFRLPRRLLMLGGASAMAAGGFAFMASNSVDATSAGQQTASVTGYLVQHITYQNQQGWGNPMPEYSVGSVKFTLTSDATSAPANAAPTSVEATLLDSALKSQPAAISCSPTSTWTINGTGNGTGSYVCNFDGSMLVNDVTGLDVEANQ